MEDMSVELLLICDINPFYISLDPSTTELADAVFQFLRFCKWYDVVLVADDSDIGSVLIRHLQVHLNSSPWRPLTTVSLRKTLENNEILIRLGKIREVHSRVVLLYCDEATTLRVFEVAEKLNLLGGNFIWVGLEDSINLEPSHVGFYPSGLLALRLRSVTLNPRNVRETVKFFAEAFEQIGTEIFRKEVENFSRTLTCSFPPDKQHKNFSRELHRHLNRLDQERFVQRNASNVSSNFVNFPVFDVLNLVQGTWKVLGNVSGPSVRLDAVLWLGAGRRAPWPLGKQRFRVVTAFAPPFVQQSTRVSNGSCLMGIPCLQVTTSREEELATIFADYGQGRSEGIRYNVTCCAGITMDLLTDVANDLHFEYDLYLVADGMFGTNRGKGWNGITADLISGAAHLAFSSYSVNSLAIQEVDFSVPYFHSGVSCLAPSRLHAVPLSAFLEPFSIELWIVIFASLNVTAIAAAVYEWLSPFGLNPWGRQRTKNFSLASALWVMWSLLFSHLVAFKAPKSWPNKVLINVWGCFSVIFLASYTAKVAALFAGLFFQLRVDDLYDSDLFNQRTGTAKGSAAEGYILREYPRLWEHVKKYEVVSIEDGLDKLRNGELDVLIGDTAVLDYYRGNEPDCNLHMLGDPIFDDAYAIGMQQGFPLKDAVSDLILHYNEAGYIDQLQQKWYGRVPCFERSVHGLTKPMGLSVRAVSGVFIMLCVGHLVAVCTLVLEHLTFRYVIPVLREKPKDTVWRSPHLMFFSQKFYRFINTVKLVSPHHSVKEIVYNLREGQIFSLFQKSVKRKAKEDARKSKSQSQFFQLIQEIRNVVQEEQEKRNLASIENIDVEPVAEANINKEFSAAPKRELFRNLRPNALSLNSDTILLDNSQRRLERLLPPHQEVPPCPSSSSDSTTSSLPKTSKRIFSISFNELLPLAVQDNLSDQKHPDLPERSRAWSFSDLRTLKKKAFLADTDFEARKKQRNLNNTFSKRKRFRTKIFSRERIEELKLYSMTKEEIINRWKTSEQELRNILRQALQYNKELEEKLKFLQKTSKTLKRFKNPRME
ncbi:glutamate receptor ionotropic, NMDA 3A-like isoform X2 [Tachypleus tridentatus]|uniref:glutamate receptor ionotropic, NMDA 3A-like isoform X2 n=1 Tax=Tachypleus tridentatus TaxID=6853 RepID=UPI003FD53822